MLDVVFVILVVSFFALAAGAVRLCDGVVGPESPSSSTDAAAAQETRAA